MNFKLYWSPTGQHIDTVTASDSRSAIRKAPLPYCRFKGEIYAIPDIDADVQAAFNQDLDDIKRDIAKHGVAY